MKIKTGVCEVPGRVSISISRWRTALGIPGGRRRDSSQLAHSLQTSGKAAGEGAGLRHRPRKESSQKSLVGMAAGPGRAPVTTFFLWNVSLVD